MRTLLNSMRCSISYASALVLASGVDSSLRDFWSCHKLVSQWAIACFFAQLIYETGSYFSRNFPPQDIVLMFMIPLALIFSIFPYWFSLIVFRTIYDLENRQQAVKLTVYRIFAYVVISASTLAYIAQFARL